jgi:hypothetical protein
VSAARSSGRDPVHAVRESGNTFLSIPEPAALRDFEDYRPMHGAEQVSCPPRQAAGAQETGPQAGARHEMGMVSRDSAILKEKFLTSAAVGIW